MKILITGSDGMVGRNILENDGILRYQPLTPKRDELDLLDYDRVIAYLGDNIPDMVIHCAGQVGGIEANIDDPFGFFTNNIVMGVNLVRASKEIGVPRLLNLASSCAYPRDRDLLKEDDLLTGPLEPTNEGYALAKLAVLKMCEYISRQFDGFAYKTLIPCNLYGRWDNFSPERSHMIPAVIRKLHTAKIAANRNVSIWGGGQVRREFMYASDLADCILAAVERFDTLPRNMNVGPGCDYTIEQYYHFIAQAVGYTGTFTCDLSRPEGMKRKRLDVSLQTHWGWSPKTPLEQGLDKTYEFYRNNASGGQCP